MRIIKIEKSTKRKRKNLQEALREEREKSNEYLDRLKYLQADFENYRKRMEREIHEKIQARIEKIVVDLLFVIDDLELAIRSGRETENKQALLEGVELTLTKMRAILEREGLSKIDAIGEKFDPRLHDVVLRVPARKHKVNIIVEEVRKGYMLRGKVIRPSIVKIAANSGDSS